MAARTLGNMTTRAGNNDCIVPEAPFHGSFRENSIVKKEILVNKASILSNDTYMG